MEHILEFQLPKRFIEWLEKRYAASRTRFPHPNPNEVDSKNQRVKIKFCDYFKETWDLDSITVDGVSAAPAQHIGEQYPTKSVHPEELVVLEHQINTPSKGKVRKHLEFIPLAQLAVNNRSVQRPVTPSMI